MVNWDDRDVKNFKKKARRLQQKYCDLLGDRKWDVIESLTILRRKVGFGIYGEPESTPSRYNRHTGYTNEQLGVIEKVCDQLVENVDFEDNDIHFACIFVVMKVYEKNYTVPVFKAKRETDSSSRSVFVDAGARKYSTWGDYLSSNTLPKCIYCYPTHGLYKNDSDNGVCVSFGTSPACDLAYRVERGLDGAATVASVATTTVGLVALAGVPVGGPIAAASTIASLATGAYGITRSVGKLHDRAAHSQSISLINPEARGSWLTIVGSSLNFAHLGMLRYMKHAARAGEVMSKAGRTSFVVTHTAKLTHQGMCIINDLVRLSDKLERNDLSLLDVYQFTALVLFFSHAVVNYKTADTIIKEVQRDVINTHREGLSRAAKKVFNKQTGRLRGPDEMHGNARVVMQLIHIEYSQDLFELMVDRNVDSRQVRLTPEGFQGLHDEF